MVDFYKNGLAAMTKGVGAMAVGNPSIDVKPGMKITHKNGDVGVVISNDWPWFQVQLANGQRADWFKNDIGSYGHLR